MRTGMIIGIAVLLVGFSILVNAIFPVSIPIVTIAFALLLIYVGLKLLSGKSDFPNEWVGRRGDSQNVIFGTGKLDASSSFDAEGGSTLSQRGFNVIFGQGTIDLSNIAKMPGGIDIPVEINTVFGETIVILPTDLPVSVRANSVFGEARLPDGNVVAFGTLNYRTAQGTSNTPMLRIHGSVVFGSLRFKLKTSATASAESSRATSTSSSSGAREPSLSPITPATCLV